VGQRFQLRVDPWWKPLLVLVGWATRGRSYVEIDGSDLVVRFGWLFSRRFSLSNIENAVPVDYGWWWGIGWRSNWFGTIALAGSTKSVVEVRLRRAARVWLGPLPQRCQRLRVSLEEPERFMEALTAAIDDVRRSSEGRAADTPA
jgi:hypothetical protein